MNNKGFTLIELIATIILLAIVASIGAYSVINLINSSKNKNYDNLIKNIKDGAETYYMECTYSHPDSETGVTCGTNVTLGNLVNYGFLPGNTKDSSGNYKLVNPKNDKDISCCRIKITSSDGIVTVTNNTPTTCTTRSSCPTTAQYAEY